jgi:hypothetical protein
MLALCRPEFRHMSNFFRWGYLNKMLQKILFSTKTMSKLPDLIVVEKCEKRKMPLKFIFIASATVVNAGGFNAI